ncbi:glycoside hydrolase family 95 protein [Serpula lacrymans var. lacrymans S7.9]|uniref:Glycoside hydrolase family 95 protein n=1 Tax=Serpula lacrymans var. lacrymans (strain S7.9) TaxID=578457 RepID=F8PAK3_SERL9|nr:glycoside hydrolase family 95 protein [Serpula lacrymans var. lacrymans S7.9]EGO19842.1 glycoside hydrolase family 95 protein [Serpula lacrymans var. lacrymans S7.9]
MDSLSQAPVFEFREAILSAISLLAGLLPQSFLMWFRRIYGVLTLATYVTLTKSTPPGFPSSGNGLWYTTPATLWAKQMLPIGNGYLAAMIPGGIFQEVTQLNIESLWQGGPLQDPSYNGGNNLPSQQAQMAQDMQSIRQSIFASPNGTINNIEEICTPPGDYGSYSGAGYFISTLNNTGTTSNYGRWLDLDEGVARTTWSQGSSIFSREAFCSHPAQACVQYVNTSGQASLPTVTYAFSVSQETGLPAPNVTCLDNATLNIRGYVTNPGMMYEIIGRVQASNGTVSCNVVSGSTPTNATVSVSGASEAWITWVGGTNYDIDAGDLAHNFTFQGVDPHSNLVSLVSSATSNSYTELLSEHIADYTSLISPFSLSLGQTPDLSTPTDQIVASYQTYVGNAYLEWVLFNFGRYLLTSSARGILPANLQGKWADGQSNSWGADYHANINLQMNYWFAEMANLNVTQSLFDYMEKTWAPRGAETALILYNISQGWVTHDEMNIFGHTGMKLEGNSAQWADYPESNAWMMIHAWDHFDYTNDVEWWKAQGWPLVKAVASFHLEKLIPDLHFNDGTLVTAPCNSPEQVPITFGCAHAQQLIWQLFNAVEKGYEAAGDTDTAFIQAIAAKREQMDKGLRNYVSEWKMDMDQPNDTHRHLSHLIGLYPGYAISSYSPELQGGLTYNNTFLNYTKEQILDAATISLIHRGNGTGPDADAGWEKVWRAACWAQLGNETEFYRELTYAIERNFAPNLFDLYSPGTLPFQIDANFGYPAAVLNALLQAPDVASLDIPLQVTLLPALPLTWSSGEIKGARIRGGITLDLQWSGGKPTSAVFTVDSSVAGRQRDVVVNYAGKVVGEFTSNPGTAKTVTF